MKTRKKRVLLLTAARVTLVLLKIIAGYRTIKIWQQLGMYATVAAGLALLVIVPGCLSQRSGKVKTVYNTDTAFLTDIVQKAVATGTVAPRKQIEVKAQVSGIIEKVYVTAGQPVKAGQLLAKIRLTPDAVNLSKAESELQKARISYSNAKIEKERFEQLFKEKVVAEKEYHEYLLNFNKANADLEEAQNTLQLVKVGASAQSGIAANEVRSTVNGILLDVPAKEGNFVIERNTFNEGTTVATIADMNDMIFTGKVEEADVNRLKPGMDLAITVRATEERTYHAQLEFISPNGVKEEGATTFEVRAAIKLDSTQFLRAGYSATADIVLEKLNNVLAVRESVVRFEKEKPYVEVEVQPQTFEKRYVQLGLSDEINIQVLGGLKATDRLKAVF